MNRARFDGDGKQLTQFKAHEGAAALLSKAWTQYANFYCEAAGMCDGTPMHDAHTVAYAIEPSMYTNVTTLAVQVAAQHARDCPYCLSLLTSRRFPLTAGARHSARAAVARIASNLPEPWQFSQAAFRASSALCCPKTCI